MLQQNCPRATKESEDKMQMEILVDNVTKKSYEIIKQEIQSMKGTKKIKEQNWFLN